IKAPLLSWSGKRDHQILSRFDGTLQAADASGGDLRMASVSGEFEGTSLMKTGAAPSFSLTADISGAGGWRGLGAPSQVDDPTIAALKRAASDFTLRAPAISAELADGALWLRAAKPVRLSTASGATAVLSPR